MIHTLDELQALADATTPGPWHHDSYGQVFSGALARAYNTAESQLPDDAPESAYDGLPDPTVCGVRRRGGEPADPVAASDAEFIAAARTAVPHLLDGIRRLESEADALRSENLTLRLQLVAAESRHAALAHPDIHAAIAETEPPFPLMDGPIPTVAGHYR